MYDESIQYAEDGYKQWSEASERKIFLFDGEMPHQVMISEYIDSVVYSYYEGNVLDDSESTIYVNRNADIQKSLHLLAANNNIGLTPESVYKLFNKNISDLRYEIEQLRKENALLKGGELTAQSDFVDMRGSNPNDVDVYERPEYNEVARKKVKKRLESEGYIFTQGVGDYSIVPGVFDPEGVLSPLVVKSCKSGQLFISPIEWEALLRPNSILPVRFSLIAVPSGRVKDSFNLSKLRFVSKNSARLSRFLISCSRSTIVLSSFCFLLSSSYSASFCCARSLSWDFSFASFSAFARRASSSPSVCKSLLYEPLFLFTDIIFSRGVSIFFSTFVKDTSSLPVNAMLDNLPLISPVASLSFIKSPPEINRLRSNALSLKQKKC